MFISSSLCEPTATVHLQNADTSIPWPNCSSSPYTVEDSLADTQSVNTARICIAEAQLENEVEFVNHDFKLVWSEEWRKHQPFNQMPYMLNKDTGYTIYESRAIAKCESESESDRLS